MYSYHREQQGIQKIPDYTTSLLTHWQLPTEQPVLESVPTEKTPTPPQTPTEARGTIVALQSVDIQDGVNVTTQITNMGCGEWECKLCGKRHRRKQRAIVHVLNKHGNSRIPCGGRCGKFRWFVFFILFDELALRPPST